MSFPKVVGWAVDLRDGKRVVVPRLYFGAFSTPYGKRLGESSSKEQDLKHSYLLAGRELF